MGSGSALYDGGRSVKRHRASMAGRTCPKCGRKNALSRIDGTGRAFVLPGEVTTWCRYCDYTRRKPEKVER